MAQRSDKSVCQILDDSEIQSEIEWVIGHFYDTSMGHNRGHTSPIEEDHLILFGCHRPKIGNIPSVKHNICQVPNFLGIQSSGEQWVVGHLYDLLWVTKRSYKAL